MKLYLHLTFVIAATLVSCAPSGIRISRDAKQQGLAQGLLTEKIKTEIATIEQKRGASCNSPIIREIRYQSSSRGGSGAIIAAREHWIVDRCGRSVIYQVDYYGPIGDGTNIHVKLIAQ